MKVLITGGGGFIGQALAHRLAKDGGIGDEEITALRLADLHVPAVPEASFPITAHAGDIADASDVASWIGDDIDLIIHLAAVVSGEAEADFDKGYRVNLRGTRCVLEAARASGRVPRVVFASSIAVFGPPYPNGAIPDGYQPVPATSYGVQKLAGELLLADYARKGFIDGLSIRLPTITVRPGKPNKAASGFFSGIIREPLAGVRAVCPVSPNVRHWVASPRAAVDFFVHSATLDCALLGNRRALTMPGLSVTVQEMVDALGTVAGSDVPRLIDWQPDETIAKIVDGWPQKFAPDRAIGLGFVSDHSMEAIIEAHIRDMGVGR